MSTGLHPENAGRLQAGRPALAPCTPAGVIEILKRSEVPISGQHAVVLGRSDIVGKPVAMLLLQQNATVTICHSKTRDLGAITCQADILVAAIGRPGFVTPEMVKPGATIIDVGINRITTREEFDRFFAGNASARPPSPSVAPPSWVTCIRKLSSWPPPTLQYRGA